MARFTSLSFQDLSGQTHVIYINESYSIRERICLEICSKNFSLNSWTHALVEEPFEFRPVPQSVAAFVRNAKFSSATTVFSDFCMKLES